MDGAAFAGALSQFRDPAGREVITEERQAKRNKRITAVVLWAIVAFFFFGVMLKYYWLNR
jgi:type VI protein secretion system component VasF